jgi:PHB/PHA accumulation regulator DNA-binding domain
MTDSACSAGLALVVIKKYDERFFDTERNAYITLNELGSRVKQRQDFTVVDAHSGEDRTRQVLAQIAFHEDMAHYMRMIIREGKVPYDLLDHQWFRGPIKEIGPHEIMLGGGCDYFPIDDIKVLNELPPTLAKKDYDVRRVEERFQQCWKRIAWSACALQ